MSSPSLLISLSVLLIFSSLVFGSLPSIRVDPANNGFVDDLGRQVYFHGVNAVMKVFPWVPQTEGFDKDNSLSSIDAKNLRSWGFNIVRLGVMWPGVEPQEGQYNQTYLGEIEKIVTLLADEGIYTILDFHQDLWHRKFCGEGVPDYVYEACKGSSDFPAPVARGQAYPIDENGNPDLKACLSQFFAKYYLADEVGVGFQCLYENQNNLWENFGNFWQTIAGHFKDFPSVLGYELINEPWMGDVYKHPDQLLPGVTEKKLLQPMYQYLNTKIRSVDDKKIVFFEGLTIDYWSSGFTAAPGGAEYNDRQAISYHIYCVNNATRTVEVACDLANDEFFHFRQKDAKRLNVGMIMTEFGAAQDIKPDLYALNKMMKMTEKHLQSYVYWQFKYYQDLTTCTPEGEGLYNPDGTIVMDKMLILSRTYPQSVSGAVKSHSFDEITKLFNLEYTLSPSTTTSTPPPPTVISYSKEIHYPNGIQVEVSSCEDNTACLSVKCAADGLVELTHASGSTGSVTVKISACKDQSQCTCL